MKVVTFKLSIVVHDGKHDLSGNAVMGGVEDLCSAIAGACEAGEDIAAIEAHCIFESAHDLNWEPK